MRPVALIGWLVIVGTLFVWQGIGLVRGPEWPTLSDFFRSFMSMPAGRAALFGLWLWLGWHLFIRSSSPWCCSHVGSACRVPEMWARSGSNGTR